jgi:hypothetical protein
VLVQCKHCGAPLDVKPNDRLVRCSYCDHTNRVRSMQTLQQMTPPNWQPPPTWTPPPQFPVRAQQPLQVHTVKQPQANTSGCVVAGIVLAIGALVAGIFVFTEGAHSSLPVLGLEATGAPTGPTLELTLAHHELTGETDDEVDAASISGTGTCRGKIPRRPHFILRATTATHVRLLARAQFDNVMVLRRADGSFFCDDDTGGNRNPMIEVDLEPGDHRVWVGEYSEEGGSFTLDVDTSPMLVGRGETTLAPDAEPLARFRAEAAQPLQVVRAFQTNGWIQASTVSPACRGYMTPAPTATIEVTRAQAVRLRTTDNDDDVTMLVRSPSGAISCDDDTGGGRNPQLDLTLEPGTTAVWIGPYTQNDAVSFTLRVEGAGGLDTNAAPLLAPPIALETAPPSASYVGSTRPTISAREVDSRCAGYVGSAPDLVLDAQTPRDVELTTISRNDLVLVVQGPDGVWCDDDSGDGQNPAIHRRFGPGRHYVWVGSFAQGRPSQYTLVLREQRTPTRRRVDHRIK